MLLVADQDEREQLVGLTEQLLRIARARYVGLGKMPQAMAVERHHRGFGNREEGGAAQQQHDGANLCPERPRVQSGRGGAAKRPL